MNNFRPMLAAPVKDVNTLRLPLYVSAKLDGIRSLLLRSVNTSNRCCYSRSLKPIPNLFIRKTIEHSNIPTGIDGELTVGDNFQDTASGVMTVTGEPNFTYHVFDYIGSGTMISFAERYVRLHQVLLDCNYPWLKILPQHLSTTVADIVLQESIVLEAGYEGLMLRAANAPYKYGRSTLSSQWLLKLKRFAESEARVLGFIELQHNDNCEETSELGYTKRSTHQDKQTPGNTLGALRVTDHSRAPDGRYFEIGSGFTAAERLAIWQNQTQFLGRKLTYKYQEYGVKNKPRSPVFLRWKLDHNI